MELDPLVGTKIGHYQIIAPIAEGGMGKVYKARDEDLGRLVAVKFLRDQILRTPELEERFSQEARIIASLEHQNIMQIYSRYYEKDFFFFVMPFYDKGTLEERLLNKNLLLSEANDYFSQICAALIYAHKHGVIHRDIKPSNIIFKDREHLLLSDFGISKIESADNSPKKTQSILGTYEYISPEQIRNTKIDKRADIYSLGVLLFQMVTGRLPFIGVSQIEILSAHLHNDPPRPTSFLPSLPEEIDIVILKALEKEADRRYSSVEEFLEAWEKALKIFRGKINKPTGYQGLEFTEKRTIKPIKDSPDRPFANRHPLPKSANHHSIMFGDNGNYSETVQLFSKIFQPIIEKECVTNTNASPFAYFFCNVFAQKNLQWGGYIGKGFGKQLVLSLGLNLEFLPPWRVAYPNILQNKRTFQNHLRILSDYEWHWLGRPGFIAKNPEVIELSKPICASDLNVEAWLEELNDILEKRKTWRNGLQMRPQFLLLGQIGEPDIINQPDIVSKRAKIIVKELSPLIGFFR